MGIKNSAPLTVGAAIDESGRIYRSSLPHLWLPAVVLAIIAAAANGAVSLVIPGLTIADADWQRLLDIAAALVSARMIALYVVTTLIALVVYGAFFSIQLSTAHGRASLSAPAALAASLLRLPRMTLAAVLNLVPIALTCAFIAIPGVYGALLGLIWLLIPGTYVWGRLQLWMAVMFAEDAGVFASLAGSWRLMQGRWWRGTTILTLAFLVMTVFSSIVLAIGESAAALSQLGPAGQQIITQIFAASAYTLASPMLSAACVAMYVQFKSRPQAGDLRERLEMPSSP